MKAYSKNNFKLDKAKLVGLGAGGVLVLNWPPTKSDIIYKFKFN